jgi:polygalacturonase
MSNLVPSIYNELNVKDFGAKGDGVTNDSTVIQAAVDALTAGDTLYFPSGTYLCDKISISGKTGITITADRATLYRPEATFAVEDQNIDIVNSTDIVIRGLTFDGENSVSIGTNRGGIEVNGSDDILIEKCHFYDVRYGVAGVNATNRVVVRNNTAESQVPITLTNQTNEQTMDILANPGAGTSTYWDISGNMCRGTRIALFSGTSSFARCTNNTVDPSPDSVIYLSGTKHFVVSGNIMHEAGKDAIKAVNGSDGGVIANNYVFGAGYITTNSPHMLQVDLSSNISITGNTVRLGDWDTGSRPASSQWGILVGGSENITVDGNNIFSLDTDPANNGDDGIRVDCGSTPQICKNINISNNTIYNMARYGINVSAETFDIENVKIMGNTITGNTDNLFGIVLFTSATNGLDTIDVLGNTIRSVSTGGIYLSVNNQTLSNIRIADNRFLDFQLASGEPIYALGTSGAYTNVIIENNYCDGTPNAFFQTQDTAKEGLIVRNNYFDDTLLTWVISLDGTINTTPYTISGMQNGTDFDNTGASALGQFNLPAAVKGMNFTFERVATQTLRVDPNGTEYFADVGTHGYKSLDTDGAYMKIECFKDGVWHVVASSGTINNE